MTTKTNIEAEEVLDRIRNRENIYFPKDPYLKGIIEALTWVYGSKPTFFEPLPVPKNWPFSKSDPLVR